VGARRESCGLFEWILLARASDATRMSRAWIRFSSAGTRRTAGPRPICHVFDVAEGVGSNSFCHSRRAASKSTAPITISFTSTAKRSAATVEQLRAQTFTTVVDVDVGGAVLTLPNPTPRSWHPRAGSSSATRSAAATSPWRRRTARADRPKGQEKGNVPGTLPPRRRSSIGEPQSHSMCLTSRPTATAVSVCRLSALTNVRPGIDTRAANSCAEATWMASRVRMGCAATSVSAPARTSIPTSTSVQ